MEVSHYIRLVQCRITTQDHENVDLKPAMASLDIETSSLVHETTNLVHDASSGLICSLVSNGPVYMRARLQHGLTENGGPRLLAEMLHAHQNAVIAYSLADAHTQSLRCLVCVNCTPSQ